MVSVLKRAGSRLLYLTAELYEHGLITEKHKHLLKRKCFPNPNLTLTRPICFADRQDFGERHESDVSCRGHSRQQRAEAVVKRLCCAARKSCVRGITTFEQESSWVTECVLLAQNLNRLVILRWQTNYSSCGSGGDLLVSYSITDNVLWWERKSPRHRPCEQKEIESFREAAFIRQFESRQT